MTKWTAAAWQKLKKDNTFFLRLFQKTGWAHYC